MKKFIYFAVICFPLLFMGCPDYDPIPESSIYGCVYDADTMNPIKGALITRQPGSKSCLTGDNGAYSFDEILDPGKYRVQAMATGYRADWRDVTVTYGENEPVDFVLHKE